MSRPSLSKSRTEQRSAGRRAGAILLLVCLLLGLPSALAAASETGDGEKKKKKSYTVTPPVYKRLDAAQQLLAEEDYAGAIGQLDALRKKKLNPHERALMWQIYGYTESSQEQYAKAIGSFQKCLAEDALPDATAASVRYNLGQLYMAEERFEEATKILEEWLAAAENPAPNAYYLMAVAYTQQERYDKGLVYAEKAVAKAKKPNEPWLQLALSLYFQLERWSEVAETLEVLVAHFPKASYWKQLASAYASLGKERKSLAVLELAYLQGFLTREAELENLAHMYLYHEVPYKAARLVERALEEERIPDDQQSWELLANSWLHAREYERALGPLERAASLAKDGKVYVKLAQLHLQQQRWAAARKSLGAALAKGDLDDPGQVHILIGISNVNEKRYEPARQAFTQARKYQKNRKAADNWLKHVERELARESG